MAKKGSIDIYNVEDPADIEAWHDQAYAAYESALDDFRAGGQCPNGHSNPVDANFCMECGAELPTHDPSTKAAYEEARDSLQAGVVYWRQVGEQLGTRTGIGVVEEGDTE